MLKAGVLVEVTCAITDLESGISGPIGLRTFVSPKIHQTLISAENLIEFSSGPTIDSNPIFGFLAKLKASDVVASAVKIVEAEPVTGYGTTR